MNLKKAIPALPVRHISEAVGFYQTKFGFTAAFYDENMAILRRDEVEIHLWAAMDPSWQGKGAALAERPIASGAESFLAGTASCRIEVVGLDALFEEYQRQGVTYHSATVVTTQPWGQRDFPTLDLAGNLLTFYEVIQA